MSLLHFIVFLLVQLDKCFYNVQRFYKYCTSSWSPSWLIFFFLLKKFLWLIFALDSLFFFSAFLAISYMQVIQQLHFINPPKLFAPNKLYYQLVAIQVRVFYGTNEQYAELDPSSYDTGHILYEVMEFLSNPMLCKCTFIVQKYSVSIPL